MAQKTDIEWATMTWNPTLGCSRVSAGCDNCYAMHFAHRFSGVEGHAFKGLTVIRNGGVDWKGTVKLNEHKLLEPLRIKKSQRIFADSMTDLFHPAVPFEYIDRVFAVMVLSPWHTYMILTKRPDRMKEYMRSGWQRRVVAVAKELGYAVALGSTWYPPNVWLGVSVEDQKTANERLPFFLEIEAAVLFVSMEPMIGEVNLREIELPGKYNIGPSNPGYINTLSTYDEDRYYQAPRKLDWVIVGGESGNGARLFHVEWARSIVRQCKDEEVPVFVKQLGRYPMLSVREDAVGVHSTVPGAPSSARAWNRGDYGERLKLKSRKGDDMSEWPDDLRVRELPGEVVA